MSDILMKGTEPIGQVGAGEIESVTYDIANNTTGQRFDLPTGFTNLNCIFLGATCLTKYNSYVADNYDNGSYFGDIQLGNGFFIYTPRVAGNSTKISFAFYKYN